jgi:hypothetical protein
MRLHRGLTRSGCGATGCVQERLLGTSRAWWLVEAQPRQQAWSMGRCMRLRVRVCACMQQILQCTARVFESLCHEDCVQTTVGGSQRVSGRAQQGVQGVLNK